MVNIIVKAEPTVFSDLYYVAGATNYYGNPHCWDALTFPEPVSIHKAMAVAKQQGFMFLENPDDGALIEL